MLDHDLLEELMGEQSRLATSGGGGEGFFDNFVKMPEKDGHITVRILGPAAPGLFEGVDKPKLYCATRIHTLSDKKVHCPRCLSSKDKRWLGDCPVCNWYSHMYKESEKSGLSDDERDQIRSEAMSFKPYERYYYNVIVRSVYNEDTGEVEKNVGPKILSVGKGVHEMIIKGFIGDPKMEEKGYGDVTDPKTGRDFKIIKTMKASDRKGKGGKGSIFAEYTGTKFLEPSPLGTKEEIEKWAGTLHNLQALRIIKTGDELKRLLKVHLGVIKDVKAGDFDPAEFQRGNVVTHEPVVSQEAAREALKEETKVTTVVAPDVSTSKQDTAKLNDLVGLTDDNVALDSDEFMKILEKSKSDL